MTHHRSLYTKEQIAAAAALWRDGYTLHAMAEKLGITCSAVKNMTSTRRGTFPYRKRNTRRADPVVKQVEEAPAPAPLKAGCVVRTTFTGAKVTLPRVAFIDGPEPESEAA
ncbi:GcrA cell cycle regulator [Agrobacterium tumefaciens]|uniref:GcrA cell cycle regulator n=1 Tax=Agrobacterium tumefaciens TaxID=358 RepID=A0A2L2LBX2_AGRTU|nr:GcrA cell cycle regulator [Agrobacterium tumefaciens]AVH41840.1 GcrA cell cycle regulator [Agrobacterium tumefaciens]NSY95758.1 GcrA cell cycle regulator [Agrobacterium tumefaciens]